MLLHHQVKMFKGFLRKEMSLYVIQLSQSVILIYV